PRMNPPFGLRNVAFADHGPTAPSISARTHHEYRLSKSRLIVGVQLGVARRPESCITTLASLNSWNRYCSVPLPPLLRLAAPDVNVGVLNVCSRVSPVGDCGEGALAFSVDPSDGVTVPPLGITGLSGGLFWHAAENTMNKAALSADRLLCICCSIFCDG